MHIIEIRDKADYPSWPNPLRALKCAECGFTIELPQKFMRKSAGRAVRGIRSVWHWGIHGAEHRGNVSHARKLMREHVCAIDHQKTA